MAFAFVAAAHGDANSTSVTVNKPTGTADGDIEFLLLKHLANEDPNSGLTGWTQLGTRRYDATSGSSHSLYYRIAASEGASYTIGWATSGRSGATVATYRDGFDTADPIDVVSDTAYTTSNATVRAAGMTVSAANSPLIWFGNTHNSSSATMTPATNPGTFVEDVDNWNSTSRWGREIASFVWTGSGATGDMDATNSVSTTTKHAFAVSLNPLVGGAITGSVSTTIGVTGTLTGIGSLTGAVALSLTAAGALTGIGALTGSIPLSISESGSLTGIGSMSGSIPLNLSPVGALSGIGNLSSAIAIAASVTGTFAASNGAMSGVVASAFSVSGALTGIGNMAGAVGLTLSPVGALSGNGAMSGSISLSLTPTGSLIAAGSGYMVYVWERTA